MGKRVGSCMPTLANPPRDGLSTNHHCHVVIAEMTTTFDSNAFDRSLLMPMLVNTTQQSNIALVSLFLFTQSSLDNEKNQPWHQDQFHLRRSAKVINGCSKNLRMGPSHQICLLKRHISRTHYSSSTPKLRSRTS